MTTRVLIVDDSPLAQRQLRDLVLAQPGYAVVAVAPNGLVALELASATRPDLVTLDLSMPVMDGLTTLKHLMVLRPTPTLIVSSFATEESHLTFECLRYGAAGFVTKPSALQGLPAGEFQDEVARQLIRAARIDSSRLQLNRLRPGLPSPRLVGPSKPRYLLVVVAGRSGIAPVLGLLNAAPCHPELAVVLVLDLPPRVLLSFSEYAARFSAVRLSAQGFQGLLRGGAATLVAFDEPLLAVREPEGVRLRTFAAPTGATPESLTRAFFSSVAESFGRSTIVTLLSGADRGVVDGLGEVAAEGGTIFVQDPQGALEPELLKAALLRKAARRLASWDALKDYLRGRLAGASRQGES